MKVKVLSDLHLEFQQGEPFHPGEGDVLVLAGDICTAYDLGTENENDKLFQQFFKDCVKNYNKVFYTLGNHEHYDFDIDLTQLTIKSHLPKGVSLLNNSSEFYGGWHFVGTTLWSDFENGNPIAMECARNSMNDYRIITKHGKRLQPKDTLKLHDDSIEWLNQSLRTMIGPIFMFSHHAPSPLSNVGYRTSDIKGAYCSDLHRLIENYPSIKYWVHGHIHSSVNYNISQCNVFANPRGYYKYQLNEGFNPQKELILD